MCCRKWSLKMYPRGPKLGANFPTRRASQDELKDEIPDLSRRIEMWQVLRKQDALRELALEWNNK